MSFAKELYKKDDILQKRPMISRSLPIVATPHERNHEYERNQVHRFKEKTQRDDRDFLIKQISVISLSFTETKWNKEIRVLSLFLFRDESTLHISEACCAYKRVTTHMWMSHVAHMNESRHTYEWVTSHLWMSHVAHMNESWPKCEWVMSHIWLVTHTGPNTLLWHVWGGNNS